MRAGAVIEGTAHVFWNAPISRRTATAKLPKNARQLELTTEKGHEDNAETRLGFAVTTNQLGKHNTSFTLHLGDLRADIQVTWTVIAAAANGSRILAATSPFMGDSSDDPKTFDAWRHLVNKAQLDVDYRYRRKDAPPFTTSSLARVDIIIVGEGALAGISETEIALLHGFICGGGRVIVFANAFWASTVARANLICKPFGLSMMDREPKIGAAHVTEEEDLVRHPLSVGVKQVTARRPSPTIIDDPARASALVVLPAMGPDLPFAAVATTQSGGELITVGTSLWWNWLGMDSGNQRLLRNLLVRAPRMR